MKVIEFIKKELKGWGKYERIIFPSGILLIIILSITINDNKIALLSTVCGICYTILAGKGKISCYFFAMISTLSYGYISYKNGIYGNLLLNTVYYFPMQIIGIINWKKHLKSDSQEIKKTTLSNKERILYSILSITFTIICYFVLIRCNDQNPIIDSITTIFSIFGFIFTIKRCLEQWYIWFIVNGLSAIMWIQAYLNGSNCFTTIILWVTYFIFSIYFLNTWKKEISLEKYKNS